MLVLLLQPMTSMYDCRSRNLHDLCLEYVCPFCEDPDAPEADFSGGDAQSTLYALAQAMDVTVQVQAPHMGRHTVPCVEDRHDNFAWQAELCLINKPGHYAVAWA